MASQPRPLRQTFLASLAVIGVMIVGALILYLMTRALLLLLDPPSGASSTSRFGVGPCYAARGRIDQVNAAASHAGHGFINIGIGRRIGGKSLHIVPYRRAAI
jgi:hypothetical protein